jgi:hypothetical protein
VADDAAPMWILDKFEERFEAWIDQQMPAEDVIWTVGEWIMSLSENPYRAATRQPDFENMWYCALPETRRRGAVVACWYWIREMDRTVQCCGLATLKEPIVP